MKQFVAQCWAVTVVWDSVKQPKESKTKTNEGNGRHGTAFSQLSACSKEKEWRHTICEFILWFIAWCHHGFSWHSARRYVGQALLKELKFSNTLYFIAVYTILCNVMLWKIYHNLLCTICLVTIDLFHTPSGQMTPRNGTPAKVISPLKPKTARHQVALELLQTERNYVEILNTILKVWSVSKNKWTNIFYVHLNCQKKMFLHAEIK
jgi:hypothetical protein